MAKRFSNGRRRYYDGGNYNDGFGVVTRRDGLVPQERYYNGGDYNDGLDVSLRRKGPYYNSGDYDGRDLRRSMEKRDGGMINEDRTAIANLPQQVIYREYPKHNYMAWDINDDISGVDRLINENTRQYRKHGRRQGEKYETV